VIGGVSITTVAAPIIAFSLQPEFCPRRIGRNSFIIGNPSLVLMA
jgi:hypothetical protein